MIDVILIDSSDMYLRSHNLKNFFVDWAMELQYTCIQLKKLEHAVFIFLLTVIGICFGFESLPSQSLVKTNSSNWLTPLRRSN